MTKNRFIVQIDKEKCTGCGECVNICMKINHPGQCSGCGKCVNKCPSGAITLIERTNNNKKNKTMKTRCLKFALMLLLAVAGFGAITMLLWNALLPGIFGFVSINFWQAIGLLALSRILFGGMGAGVMGRYHHNHDNAIHAKWRKMTPEQRRKLFDKRMRFGFGKPYDKGHFDMGECEEAEQKTTEQQ